ncbi:MAG: hypothetical protein IRY92_09585 [Dactylosporangium sp.]|nr:hypothetical protein [Dactylosporangium sp.]
MPRSEDLDPRLMVVSYDDVSDTLMLHFFGQGRPAVSMEVRNGFFLRVDPETHQVVGVQVEAFLSRAVIEDPELLEVAEAAGIPEQTIQRIRRRITPDAMKAAAASTLLRRLQPATT